MAHQTFNRRQLEALAFALTEGSVAAGAHGRHETVHPSTLTSLVRKGLLKQLPVEKHFKTPDYILDGDAWSIIANQAPDFDSGWYAGRAIKQAFQALAAVS